MENNIIPKIKEKIEKLMLSQGYKKYSLAEKAEVAYPTIQNWYSNRNYQPSLESLIKVCDVLNISLSQLFLTDEEEIYVVRKEEKELLKHFQLLKEENKELILTLIKVLTKE